MCVCWGGGRFAGVCLRLRPPGPLLFSLQGLFCPIGHSPQSFSKISVGLSHAYRQTYLEIDTTRDFIAFI